MKIKFESVMLSAVIWLILLLATTSFMRIQQMNAFGRYIIKEPLSTPRIDVRSSFANMDKYWPWDRDFDKMVVYEKDE